MVCFSDHAVVAGGRSLYRVDCSEEGKVSVMKVLENVHKDAVNFMVALGYGELFASTRKGEMCVWRTLDWT